jgi:hypothetical protein
MARMDANQRRHTQRCPVAGVASKHGYARHRPEDTVLYQVVARHAGSFFDSLSEQGASLPGFVREEFDAPSLRTTRARFRPRQVRTVPPRAPGQGAQTGIVTFI